jgi:glycerophosphoryl diester phosphodiesterase
MERRPRPLASRSSPAPFGPSWIRELAPDLTLGYVSAVAVGGLRRLPVDFLAVSRAQLSSRLLRSAREGEMDVLIWTVNDPGAMAELILRGVDGLITDRPGRAHRVNRELQELPAAGRLLLRFHGVVGDPDPTDATGSSADAPGPLP